MGNMGRFLSCYVLVAVAVMSTTLTTAQTTPVTIIMTELITATYFTTKDTVTSTSDSSGSTLVPGSSMISTTNSSLSSSSSSLLSTTQSLGSTLTLSSSTTVMSTDEGTATTSSITNTESDTVTTASDTANTLSSSSSLLSNTYAVTEIVTDRETTLAGSSSPSSTITEAKNMMTSGSYTTSSTSDPSSPSSSTLSRTTDMEPSTEPMTNPTSNTTTEPSTEAPTETPTNPPTEAPTKAPTEPIEPTSEKPKVGPVPEPTFPDIDCDAEKTYQFEFAVVEDTAGGCMSSNLASEDCVHFKNNITQELEDVYRQNRPTAFKTVEVVLRAGSIIVNHTVIYIYNKMTDEDKMASAQSIYDSTLGQAVVDGELGNYTVVLECGNCAPPEETSTICDLNDARIDCPSYSNPVCQNNYWICESDCDTNYCNGHGICWQRDDLDSPLICSCDWDNGEWYWGYKCQYYTNQIYLIIGCSCGGAVLLVLLVSCIAYLCVKTSQKSDKALVAASSKNDDDVIHAFHNLGLDHTTETNFPPIEDLDDGDILQRRRPYSYIYTKGEENANMDSASVIKNQNGVAQRESKLEVNDGAAAKRQSNGISDTRHSSFLKSNGSYQQKGPEFWGNVDEASTSEAIKLEPVLDHIDVNQSYKIQRPRISTNYSYSNTSATPNVYQSIGPGDQETQFIPEPDYEMSMLQFASTERA